MCIESYCRYIIWYIPYRERCVVCFGRGGGGGGVCACHKGQSAIGFPYSTTAGLVCGGLTMRRWSEGESSARHITTNQRYQGRAREFRGLPALGSDP
jgi:hypothetical protein